MIHFDLPKQKSSIIKVIGVGGGGSNAVNYMSNQHVEGVDFIVCNTDAKAIEQSIIPNKIQLGPHLTQGLGAGANPEVGKAATEESLQEIKSILEVNTKMAFITAGMGGGTGTGGAPIVAQLCKEMGILTVGIVTTPFGFEGPRRMQQAEAGIKALKPYVDTLLVISNDKLRMQYGNLKMKEAFGKADNVLATAAKCITDIINSKGHIIVDFADVCTVMKNGGVAILGKAETEGENRAQRAIEEALNSPLLNDSDIKGAKWILININSAEGEHECTMDELELINSYLRLQAGEDTDVIVGMGYDNTLGNKVGITLIATGFEHKDPFAKPIPIVKPEPKPEKIIVTLGIDGEENKLDAQPLLQQQTINFNDDDPFAPQLSTALMEEESISLFETNETFYPSPLDVEEREAMLDAKETEIVHFELSHFEEEKTAAPIVEEKVEEVKEKEEINPLTNFTVTETPTVIAQTNNFLNKPSNIYALNAEESKEEETPATTPVAEAAKPTFVWEAETEENLQFEVKEKVEQPQTAVTTMQDAITDEGLEEQRRKAAERLQKLRNLSFNLNSSDSNAEFDSVPAYIRRNMELFGNTLTSVENFYSKYTVDKDENNNTQISTLNSFLEGKKPD
ncbi:MAG: cell division protein FtsZ [Bacteroidetes bacterium]|nr:cell division protein FtsZ [Bacteroidota bacterium]MBS1648671.1 cell division protein FtsZ [Bacteroidota bacterium]